MIGDGETVVANLLPGYVDCRPGNPGGDSWQAFLRSTSYVEGVLDRDRRHSDREERDRDDCGGNTE